MKKLLSLFLVLGIVGSVRAEKLDIQVNAPANEESNSSWENEEMKVEATVAPYDDERVQIGLTLQSKGGEGEEAIVMAQPRIITYMGQAESLVLLEGQDDQLEIRVKPVRARKASLKVEVEKEVEVEAVEEGKEAKDASETDEANEADLEEKEEATPEA